MVHEIFSRSVVFTSAVAVAAALTSGGATAQTSAVGVPEASAGLVEIVVTAERRSENLQRTPIAVTALSADQLEQNNIRTSQDLMQVTPGLQVSTQTAGDGGQSATFFLRGFGQQRAGNGSQPAVGIYIDDFYYPSVEGALFNILDLQQVEVLRGPQGTLFGRDTIGGAIRYTTQKPDDQLDGHVSATFGNLDRQDFVGALNAPIGPSTSVRLTVGSLDDNGYVKREIGGSDAGGVDTLLARLQLRSHVSDSLTIDLAAQYSQSHEYGFPYNLQAPIIQPIAGALPPLQAIWNSIPPLGGVNPYDARYLSTCTYCQAGTNPPEFSRVENHSLNATVAWDVLSGLQIKSLTGFTGVQNRSDVDLDGSPLPILDLLGSSRNNAFTQEFQVNGNTSNSVLKWITGVYLFDQTLITDPSHNTAVGAPSMNAASTTYLKSYAGYGDITYQVTDLLSAFGGYRYSAEHQTTESTQTAKVDFPSSTGRVGVQYQWLPTVMTYASISQGFRSGGINVTPDGALHEYRPETDISYEVGGRLEFLDNHLRINPTVFFNDWNDIQIQFVQPYSTGPLIYLANAAKAHTYGFELEAQGAVTDQLLLFGNLSTLHAEYISVGSALGIITTDSRFERAPKLTYNVGGSWTAHVLDTANLVTTLNWSYQGAQASTPSDGPVIDDTLNLPAYGLFNGRVQYVSPGKHYLISLFSTNILNKTYYVGGANYAPTSGAAHYDLGRPREYGVTAEYKF